MDDKDINGLIILITENNQEAYKTLFWHYYQKLEKFSYNFVQKHEIAEEIVSDVMINIWRNRKSLRNITNITLYLYKSTRNRSYNYINREVKYSRVSDLDQLNIADEKDPSSIIISSQLQAQLDKAVNSLPPRCKMCYQLIKEDGLSYKEVADIMSISERTVNAQMVSAMKKLSDLLREDIINYFKK
ncbi:MAG: RNA polymerase sigma-70 factor [Arachidicoccus sp.]|nr:RNA polymerase sigma-70 factor [Arachidicoccus sp.]